MIKEKDRPDLLVKYFKKTKSADKAIASAVEWREAFDAMMEGVALMLDLVEQIEFTYVTKNGNTIHIVMDSP